MGLTFNMGLTKKIELHSYWSTHPMPIYSSVMSRTRYETIMRFLHFNDNSQCPPRDNPNHDKLFKLRPLINSFSQRFAETFT
ncbi:transposase, partial [Klebsiella pneumoniae]|uniref:transposase n=1 Tax=Klebsiella pneumoniae TaxID=573 RepID=UPI001D0DE856